MPVVYADASALTKLVWDEAESAPLEAYLEGADLVSSELAIVEVPRALQRIAAEGLNLALEPVLVRAEELLDEIAMLPVESDLPEAAAILTDPALRSLDAVHVVTAADLEPIAAFVTYDIRQAAAARLAGLRTVMPGF